MTKAQAAALKWLRERGGDGAFDKHGVSARGEWTPVTRTTRNALRDMGLIEFYNPHGKGCGRLRLTKQRGVPC